MDAPNPVEDTQDTQDTQDTKITRVDTGMSSLFSLAILLWWFSGMVVAPAIMPKVASIIIPPVGMYYAMERALCVGKIVECVK